MKDETAELNKTIIELQEKRIEDLELQQEDLHSPFESDGSNKVFEGTFREVSTSTGIRNNVLGFAIGIGTGYLIKKLWIGKSKNTVVRLFGTLIHFAVANAVANRADSILSSAGSIRNRVLKNRK